MSARGRALGVVAIVATLAALSTGCEREARRFKDPATPTQMSRDWLAAQRRGSAGGEAPAAPNPYARNAWAVSEGKRLFTQMNCTGCHASGGGDIGPALADAAWIYGGRSGDVFVSIVEGRPNGMPGYGGRLTVQQVWQLVSYVQSMSGQLRKDVRPGRSDNLYLGQSEQARRAQPSPRLEPARAPAPR